ncbi:MAG: hypothetical protein P8Y64_13155 [Gammaproteobacteria bacterium]|jgi:hypothetical protein
MDRDASQPLTTEQAKARLRAAAEQASPVSWVKRYPLGALSMALVGGFVAARFRLPTVGGLFLAEKLISPLLLGVIKRK